MDEIIDPRKPKELARNCPIDIYLSGHEGAGYGKTYFPWPYRMSRPGETSSSYYNDTDKYILDSGISRDEIDNDEVIKEALKINPNYVVAADVLHEPEKTTDRVIEFLDLADDYGLESDIIIPLQPSEEGLSDNYVQYQEVEGLSDYYAVGGMMKQPDSVKRKAVKNLRNYAGSEIKIHGFSFDLKYFANKKVIKDPLIDSLDSSNPIQMGRKGEAWTWNNGVDTIQYPKPQGSFALLQVAIHSGLTLITTARMILNQSDITFNDVSIQRNRQAKTNGPITWGDLPQEAKDLSQEYPQLSPKELLEKLQE